MRRLAAFVLVLLLPAAAYAESAIVVERLTVQVGSTHYSILMANVSESWLASWNENRQDRREVTLQPVNDRGVAGPARTFKGCTLESFSGVEGKGSNLARVMRLRCEE